MSGESLWVGQAELADALQPTRVLPDVALDAGSGRILVRLHGEPLGFLSVASALGDAPLADLAPEIQRAFGVELRAHLARDGIDPDLVPPSEGYGRWDECAGLSAPHWAEPITVVVCTRDRPGQLSSCLEALSALDHPSLEILIVDNAPRDDQTRKVVEAARQHDPRFRYAVEPMPGLSHARNLGLAEARHDYVAFTDDDVVVDPRWLDGIARGFGRDALVGCVTGLVPAARLDTPAQQYFDQRCSWSNLLVARVYDLMHRRGDNALFPYSPGVFGTGANFAVDRLLVQQIGGFDTALGAGSPAGGGEDLDMFIRVLQAKRALAFEPGAIVWHAHREEDHALDEQMYDYGRGLSALISKHLLDRRTAMEVVRRLPGGLGRLATLWRWSERSGEPQITRSRHVYAEARGMLAGPTAYRRGRRAARRAPPFTRG